MLSTIVWLLFAALPGTYQTPAKVDFGRDVQPIFREHCLSCHGASQQMRGLRLDRRRDALPNRAGANGVTIVPGNSNASRLYQRIAGSEAGLQMPPAGPLGSDQIRVIQSWIDQGAEWPDELSGEASAAPPHPQAAQMMAVLRSGDRAKFQSLVRNNPGAINRHGPGGSTPLIHAALYGDAESVRLLLENGADPNLANPANATALMYAVDDVEKTRLLLEHGAKPNARSDEGRTALVIAAGRPGATPVVKLLLQHGADAAVQVSSGPGVLARVAATGDESLLRLLLENGAITRPLPLSAALRPGCSECLDLLMKIADRSDLNAALAVAIRMEDANLVRILSDRGAEPPGNAVNLDTSASPSIPNASPAPSVRAAVAKSIPPLQRADVVFIQKAGCVSCHNNSLTAMAMAAARENGIAVDNGIARSQLQSIASFLNANRERGLQGLGIPGAQDTVGYILLGMTAEKYPADTITDAWAHYLNNLQLADGRWFVAASRPPLESSSIQTTAAAMRALQLYGIKSRRAEYNAAVQRAASWLEKAEPKHTEDRVFKILGLKWAGRNQTVILNTAKELLATQRADGGWSQLPSMASDAYATGQAMVALKESGILGVKDPAYQRGVQFLLNSQLGDGSWFVRTRTSPVQPYFDSEFPHGLHQFISAAASNWAVMALAPAAR